LIPFQEDEGLDDLADLDAQGGRRQRRGPRRVTEPPRLNVKAALLEPPSQPRRGRMQVLRRHRPTLATTEGDGLDNPSMARDPDFAPDLYSGTARHYDRFRVPYPGEMIEEILTLAEPSGHGRLLDLACGTGQITFAMDRRFHEVWAVDQEPDMVDLVRHKAQATRTTVRALRAAVEDLQAPAGGFELIAIGNTFHRLRRGVVAAKARDWLKPGGSIALLWSTGPWAGNQDWQRTLADLLHRWRVTAGVESRVPAGWDRARREQPDAEVLIAAGFESICSGRFPTRHSWTPEALIGLVYSTSSLPRAVLVPRADEFETELRREFGRHARDGKLGEMIDFAYDLARRPA